MLSFRKEAESFNTLSFREMKNKFQTLSSTSMSAYLQASKIRRFYNTPGAGVRQFGVPISNFNVLTDRSVSLETQAGYLTVMTDGSGAAYLTREIEVTFFGAQCVDESNEWSVTDEPYFFISYVNIMGESSVQKIGPVEGIGTDPEDNHYITGTGVLFNFKYSKFFLYINIFENDKGSVDEAEKKVSDAIKEVAQTAASVAALIDPSLSSGASLGDDGLFEKAATKLAWIFTAVFGLGDDTVGSGMKVFCDYKDPQKTPKYLGEFLGNPYNFMFSYIGNSNEGAYNLYFDIQVNDVPPHPIPIPVM